MTEMEREPDVPLDDEAPPRSPSEAVLVFEALYEYDVARHRPQDVLERLAVEQGADAATVEASRALLARALAEQSPLDATIARLAPAWPLAQMSAIDRNILRLGLLALARAVTPAQQRAAINAAVYLARQYGGESSPRFVRGVLSRAAEERRSAEPSGEPDPPGHAPRTL